MATFWHWMYTFVHSPGFGGIAAVTAAAVAYASARVTSNKQYETAQKDRDQQRETAARDRWWDQAKWAFDRLDNPKTQASALEAFDALLDRAEDDSERAFVTAALRPGLDPDVVQPVPTPKPRGRFRHRLLLGHTVSKGVTRPEEGVG